MRETDEFNIFHPSQLSEMNAEASAAFDGAVSAMEYALKSKGISADMFPSGSAPAAAPAAEATPEEVSSS